jgi:membrane protease YdiL (CAAX protease family)
MPLALLATMLAMGMAVLAASLSRFGANLKDRSSTGAAWVMGSLKDIVTGLGLGVMCVIVFFAVASVPFFHPRNLTPGPLTKMAMTPGIPQITWVILATLLAPPIEEMLFRGVMYGGYRRSFGPRRAAILVTLIFCAMHLTEVFHSPIALFGIGSMASAALWMRLRAGAIGPAVAVHFSYNTVISIVQVIGSLAGS